MRRTTGRALRRAASFAAAAAVLAACGVGAGPTEPRGGVSVSIENIGPSPTDDGSDVTGEPEPEPSSTVQVAADAARYVACTRTAPSRGRTHLAPVRRIDASNDVQPGDGPIPRGQVRLEDGGTLPLVNGVLAAGNGYEAALGGAMTYRVAHGRVEAPVTLAVLDSPQSGRRVAFVEVQLSDGVPVRWVQEPKLAIVTDGGDGGFAADVPPLRDDQVPVHDYVDAFYPGGDSSSGNVCVQRLTSEGRLDAVLFSTGYGDGGYGTFLGLDAVGTVVSVVHSGSVLPWSMSGLPGRRPPADEVW